MTSMLKSMILTAIVSLPLATSVSEAQDLRRLRGAIKVDGSSTVYPITEAVAESFKEAAPNVR